ncbi:hypothetical protein [Methylomonas sp. 11b]|uniref:hypothetical protein n=1 Tax=Methylomonas sp. 11b TaxID=1168169 RepID=UPI0004797225|nr:hypothetical protein [Methylomonas sp. 11b]
MIKRFKVDAGFIPCPVNEGDELYPNGIFEFNISCILEHIQRNPTDVALVEITVNDFYHGFSSLNESQVELADMSKPVVLAEISPGKSNLIDGHHRLEKARRSGVCTLRAHKLTAVQHLRFLTSERAYLSYIEYWNGKVKQLRQVSRAEHCPNG